MVLLRVGLFKGILRSRQWYFNLGVLSLEGIQVDGFVKEQRPMRVVGNLVWCCLCGNALCPFHLLDIGSCHLGGSRCGSGHGSELPVDPCRLQKKSWE